MMRPKILIAMHYMELGGAEAALLGLLPEIEAYAMLEEPISLLIRKGYWRLTLARLWGKWECQKYSKKNVLGLESNARFVPGSLTLV